MELSFIPVKLFHSGKRELPFGSGATVSYNYLDLMIRNDTNQPYQLHVYLTKNQLVGEWKSTVKPIQRYEVYEKEHRITHEYWVGYIRHNLIFRRVFNIDGDLIDDQYVTENHAIMMYQPFLEGSIEDKMTV